MAVIRAFMGYLITEIKVYNFFCTRNLTTRLSKVDMQSQSFLFPSWQMPTQSLQCKLNKSNQSRKKINQTKRA